MRRDECKSMWISIVSVLVVTLLVYSIIPTIYYKKKLMKASTKAIEEKQILLTFDDGPDERYTPKLLDLLKKYQVKASFFVVAKKAEGNKEIIERIIKEGHSLCFHSLEHKNALFKGGIYTRKDFTNSLKIIEENGWQISYYRPPWGHINLFTLLNVKKYHLKMVLWTVMAGDWAKKATKEKIAHRLIDRVQAGDIICLHDGRGAAGAPLRTIGALQEVIPELINRKYKFINIEEYYGEKNK